MHYLKEYISNYNKSKNSINLMLTDIEECLDKLFSVKELEEIIKCKEYLENTIDVNIEIIEDRIALVVKELNKLQTFCYEDIKNIIPFIEELKKLEDHDAFIKAKDINYIIECIKKSNDANKVFEKRTLLEIAEFNKRVRYFIHTTLAIAENPLPIILKKKIQKNIKEKWMMYTGEELFSDVSYLMSEVYRIKKNLDQFHILTNSDYGNWTSKKITLNDIAEYFKLYKSRFYGFYFNEKVYHIETLIICKPRRDIELFIPIDKVKEILDVLLHNAADELVEKEELEGKFGKRIICEILEADETLSIAIKDNGRGFNEDEEVEKPFYSRKLLKLNSQGIGLDIARSNTKIIGGDLEKENLLNGGACFKLKIPKEVNIKTESFGVKINIAVIGEFSKAIKNELEKIKKEHNEHRIINIKNADELSNYLMNVSIDAIDIMLQNKDVSFLKSFTINNFKGKIITV